MLPHVIYVCSLLIIVVESYEFNWKFLNGSEINDPSYCDTQHCIAKCCPSGHLIVIKNGTEICMLAARDRIKKAINFSRVSVYDNNKKIKVNENLASKFVFMYDENVNNNSHLWTDEFKIFEDGSMMSKDGVSLEKLLFCVDFQFIKFENGTRTAVIVYKSINADDPDSDTKQLFLAVGMLVSCVFLLLVLGIYSLLPAVRGGLWGIMLMTYLAALMITFALKAWRNLDSDICEYFSFVTYYFILANFFWSNVISFHMWNKMSKPTSRSTIRSIRAAAKLDKEDKKKLRRYCAYALGTPALVTGCVVAVDQFHWYSSIYYRPPFEDCLTNRTAVMIYVNVPVAIMTIANCILFIMTAYYIWFVERNIVNSTESRCSRTKQNRFILYLKISLLMGVSWLLELFPPNLRLTLFIIVGFCNVFSGVFIFFILVWKIKVYILLCKKFGISSKYENGQQHSSYRRQSSTETSIRSKNYKEVETGDETTV